MATVVDLPEVPAIATVFLLRVMAASKSERSTIGIPNCLDFRYSTLSSSMAVEITNSSVFESIPVAF